MSIIRDAIVAELQDKIERSREYYNQFETAKTTTKKNLYKKKLQRNNLIIADLLEQLNAIDQKHKKNENNG